MPSAINKINSGIVGAGRIIGVGNGDRTSHEPDTFVEETPARGVDASIPQAGAAALWRLFSQMGVARSVKKSLFYA